MKKLTLLTLVIFCLTGCQKESSSSQSDSTTPPELSNFVEKSEERTDSHHLVKAAREQIGKVTKYDTRYYVGAYPPSDRGACTDVIEQALRTVGYNLKEKIDADMGLHPQRYPHPSDPNINFRRVRNVEVFLKHHAENLSTCTQTKCFQENLWQPGDIVTFDQIPGSLWHIALVSDHYKIDDSGVKIPLLIHNYGFGVVENNKLLTWPAPITGHFRLTDLEKS